MKAVISSKAGPPEVLRISDIPVPEPDKDEIRIRVEYATVTAGDIILRKMPRALLAIVGMIAGFKPMKIPGVEYSGTVDRVGEDVRGYSPGDRVCGTATGLRFGANAEYLCVPTSPKTGVLAAAPDGVSMKDAAACIVGGMTARFLLNNAGLAKGESVLIYGASGSVGSFAVQLARYAGARVSAVCSAGNHDAVKKLGAERLIDYRTEDFTDGNDRYDVIFDAVGKLAKGRSAGNLTPGGRFVSVKSPTRESSESLQRILELTADGDISPLIDREFPLEDIVLAHRHVQSGRKRGNVIIRINPGLKQE